MLREAPLDLGGDVGEQRAIFDEMMAATPVPADVTSTPGMLGGVPVVTVDVAGESAGGGLAAMLDEGAAALTNAGAFLRTHLGGAPTA